MWSAGTRWCIWHLIHDSSICIVSLAVSSQGGRDRAATLPELQGPVEVGLTQCHNRAQDPTHVCTQAGTHVCAQAWTCD